MFRPSGGAKGLWGNLLSKDRGPTTPLPLWKVPDLEKSLLPINPLQNRKVVPQPIQRPPPPVIPCATITLIICDDPQHPPRC